MIILKAILIILALMLLDMACILINLFFQVFPFFYCFCTIVVYVEITLFRVCRIQWIPNGYSADMI